MARKRDWSELHPDVLQLVLERLSLADFNRAKTVCSAWYSASRQCPRPKLNRIPWLILFPNKESNNNNNKSSCLLLNPEEEDRVYTSGDLGVDFTKSLFLASSGCWLLISDPRSNLYILNMSTLERINLPPVESQHQHSRLSVDRTGENGLIVTYRFIEVEISGAVRGLLIHDAALWVDERSKDYVVVWSIGAHYGGYAKKGDAMWREIPRSGGCLDLACRDGKIYFYGRSDRQIRIIDVSGEASQDVYFSRPFNIFLEDVLEETQLSASVDRSCFLSFNSKLVVTVSGDVLMVTSGMKRCKNWLFAIYKINSPKRGWEIIDSLGDEALILDAGIAVLAKDIEGINANSIYFSGHYRGDKDIFIFNLATKSVQQLQHSAFSSTQFHDARWFFPGSCGK